MSAELIDWLSQELDLRRLSHRKLADQAGYSHTLISKVLSGKMNPSSDFCIRIAVVLGEPPEKLLRLAGHIPPSSEPGATDKILEELLNVAEKMTSKNREDLLNYARYRYQQQQEKKKQVQ